MMKLGSTQSISNLSRNYAKAMGRSGLPEKPDHHTTSPGAIKCDLVFTMVLIGLRLASKLSKKPLSRLLYEMRRKVASPSGPQSKISYLGMVKRPLKVASKMSNRLFRQSHHKSIVKQENRQVTTCNKCFIHRPRAG